MPVFLISTGRLIFCYLFRGLSGRVLIVCADLLRIAGILHKFRIYRCAGLGVLIFRHDPAMESGRTSPGAFLADYIRTWLQNFRAHKLKAIISEYLRMWTCRTPTEPRKPYKAYKYTIDIVKAIICLYCQIVNVRKEAGRIRLLLFVFFY